MSRFERVKQWAAFSRTWHVYDAKWQNPFQSAKVVTKYLEGKNKPVYHPFTDAGDHVVVINSKEVSLLGREWQYRVYFHHTGYPAGHRHKGKWNGALWIPAWQIHDRDPTLIMWKAVYNNMAGDAFRKNNMARLHVYPGEEVPEEILANVTSQIPSVRPVPRKLSDYSEEERRDFPKVFEHKEQFLQK